VSKLVRTHFAIVALALVNCPTAALAAERTFIGTWASDRAACSIPLDKRGAPMILTATGYDQHETHCTFKSVTKGRASTWTIAAACSVEGDAQKHTFKVTASRDRLTLREGGKAQTLVRCQS
jgi:hypothetical protein